MTCVLTQKVLYLAPTPAPGAWMTNWYRMDAFVMILEQWGPVPNMNLAFGFALLRPLNIMLHLASHRP